MSAIPGFGNVRFSYGEISLFNARCFPAEQFAGSTFASSKKKEKKSILSSGLFSF